MMDKVCGACKIKGTDVVSKDNKKNSKKIPGDSHGTSWCQFYIDKNLDEDEKNTFSTFF